MNKEGLNKVQMASIQLILKVDGEKILLNGPPQKTLTLYFIQIIPKTGKSKS